jgi:hypothetical protein
MRDIPGFTAEAALDQGGALFGGEVIVEPGGGAGIVPQISAAGPWARRWLRSYGPQPGSWLRWDPEPVPWLRWDPEPSPW